MDLGKRLEGEERGDRDIAGRDKCFEARRRLVHAGTAQPESSWTRPITRLEKLDGVTVEYEKTYVE